MTKIFIHLCIAFTLSVIELSFFSSLHGILRFTPFVFVVSVYVLQHHSVTSSLAWMLLHGLLLDISGLAVYPPVTVAYLIAGIIAVMSSNRLFSNRSFYGVLACALLSYGSFLAVEFSFLLIRHATSRTTWPVSLFFADAWRSSLVLILFLFILFSFAKRIRHLLEKGFLIPKSKQTL